MDPLRQEIKRLLDNVETVILERHDIEEILDGRVDGIIAKHKSEDKVFSQTLAQDIKIDEVIITDTDARAADGVIITDKKSLDSRTDMEADGVIDTQQYTLEMAQQIITAFEQNYDEQTVQDIENRRGKKGKKAKREVREYDEALAIINQLKEQHNI